MAKLGETVTMKCDLCIACCEAGARVMPEFGDDPKDYKTTEVNGATYLALDSNGMCIYADPKVGCTIYDNRPAQCRAFDCREHIDNDVAGRSIRDAGVVLLEKGE